LVSHKITVVGNVGKSYTKLVIAKLKFSPIKGFLGIYCDFKTRNYKSL
jgi:hypothetical protein